MSHLDEGTLHALLDGEVPSADLSAVERHLAHCRECQARLEEARAFRNEAFGLIEALDESEHREPVGASANRDMFFESPDRASPLQEAAPVSPAPAAKRAASGSEQTGNRTIPPVRPWVRWGRPLAWAATIVVAVGLGYTWRGRSGPDQASPAAVSEQVAADTRSFADSAPRDAAGAANPAEPEAQLRATPSEPAAAPPPARPEARAVPRQESVQPPVATSSAADRDVAKAAAAAAPAPRAAESPALNRMAAARARTRTDDTTRLLPIERPIALSEVITTGVTSRPPSISADSAIRLLGGSLRLIEGWNPDRYELVDSTVRVVYRTPYGEVALEQWQTDRAVGHQLVTPPSAPSDSVAAWRSRIR